MVNQKKITFWQKLTCLVDALVYSSTEHHSKLLFEKSREIRELEFRVKKLENKIEVLSTMI
ncbi:hypothetical protein A9Q74_02310 [Colwellia sp. 39_35_sub15_T18]|nr:hypothetical protein A9Q74_02310 [Colwellia sp. 39_35_sub15_T18]